MENAEQTLLHHVKARLEAQNTNAFAVEKAAGLPEDAIRSILRGEKTAGTTINKAQAVCEALGLELYIGPKRTDRGNVIPFGASEPGPPRPISGGLPAGGYRLIPWHSRARQMTPQPLAFHERLLSDLGLNVENLSVVAVEGTYHLLDTRAPRAGYGSWAILQDGAAAIARLRFDGAMVIVVPASAAPPYTATVAEVNRMALGKVIWSGSASVSA